MEKLVSFLKEKGLTIGSIESMTAGLFAASIAAVPGASKVFKGSVVSYSRLIKENVVGIDPKIIDKFGVVSSEVAHEMASKGKRLLDVDICVSITGNAGPTSEPGSAGVGETYIAVAYKDKVEVFKNQFSGDRNKIREQAVLAMQELVPNIKDL